MNSTGRSRATWVQNLFRPSNLVSATLVEEEEAEVVEARPVGYFERKWKRFAFAIIVCFVSIILAVVLPLSLRKKHNNGVQMGIIQPT